MKGYFTFQLLFLLAYLPIAGYSKTITVPDEFNSIQLAIENSVDGDTILVNPGTYYENINYNGKNVVIGSLYIVDKSRSHITSTIIDGFSSASVVVFENNEDNNAVLEGLSITNGNASQGGGIYCYNVSPTLSNLIIKNNSSSRGGGVSLITSNAILNSCIIMQNSAWNGAGLYIYNRNYINPSIRNLIIARNKINTNREGGGIFVQSNDNRGKTQIINCTIVFNEDAGIVAGEDTYIKNSIVWGNEFDGFSYANISYSDIQGGVRGEKNIMAAPLFVDSQNNNFRLSDLSPCLGLIRLICKEPRIKRDEKDEY